MKGQRSPFGVFENLVATFLSRTRRTGSRSLSKANAVFRKKSS